MQNSQVLWDPQNLLDFDWSGKKSIAQGTIEYLVIIAVVIVLSLVVVGLVLSQVDNSKQVSSSSNALGLASQVIGVTESLVSPTDGNFVVKLLNNSGEFITVSNVKVGDSNINFSQDLAQGSSKLFKVSTLNVCELGKIISEDVVVTYVTVDGLVKTQRFNDKVMFDCTPFTINQMNLANQCPSCEVCADPGFGFIEFATPSYSDGGSGTVIDSANNLVWQASRVGSTITWQDAMDYCDNLSLGDSSEWRLPNMAEVGLLYNYTSASMYGSPFTSNFSFWSSTTVPSNTSGAYRLNSSGGTITNFTKTSGAYNSARCVRSGN